MSAPATQQKQRGFTLVELLIVVIILAILAAIVVPQFSAATTDAQESALDSNLNAMRSAIELYKVQHGNAYPGANTAVATACSGTTGTGTGGGGANGAQAFIDQLLMYSDVTGKTCSVGDPTTYKFGPYLRKGIPNDGVTGKGSLVGEIVVPATPTGAPLAPAAAIGGWAYDTKSGQIVMNSNALDSKSKAFSTH